MFFLKDGAQHPKGPYLPLGARAVLLVIPNQFSAYILAVMKGRVWVLPGVAMTALMSLNIVDFQLMTFSIVLLSGPINCAFICFWGDLDLKIPPVKFLFSCTYYIIHIQKEHVYPYTQIFVCAISGKKIFTWKKIGNMERFGRQAMNRWCEGAQHAAL